MTNDKHNTISGMFTVHFILSFFSFLSFFFFFFFFASLSVFGAAASASAAGGRGLGLQRTASSSVVALSDPTAVSALCVEVAAAYCTHLFALALLLSLLRRLLRGFLGRLRLVLFGTHRLRYVAATTCLLFRRKKAGAKSRRVVNVGAGRRPADEQQE